MEHNNQSNLIYNGTPLEPQRISGPPWKIIIADDEEEVHIMTKMVLKKFTFQNRGVELLCAYSGEQVKALMRNHDDVAIVLIDVVMETEDAGLDVVKFIRNELQNPFVRIILRTGQPGQAPQDEVIRTYDINDYKSKTELTVQKLYTSVIASLRAYTDMKFIDSNRRGLEFLLSTTKDLFSATDLDSFYSTVLMKFVQILGFSANTLDACGLILGKSKSEYIIIKSIKDGVFDNSNAHFYELPLLMQEAVLGTTIHQEYFTEDELFVTKYALGDGAERVVLIKSSKPLSEVEVNLFRLFSANVKVALENLSLNKEIIDTQKEVIYTLGEIVESRSKETANHVIRVAEYSYLLALEYGMDSEEAELLKMASPMHDIGKIGIPDLILNKPGKLTVDEFEIIKTHTSIGYDILRQSKRKIMRTAAILALGHHERWDGTGYPNGIKGQDIDIYSRITSLADVFDALSHKRCYKDAWPLEEVREYLMDESGKMFDPSLVDLFMKHWDQILKIKEQYPDL